MLVLVILYIYTENGDLSNTCTRLEVNRVSCFVIESLICLKNRKLRF